MQNIFLRNGHIICSVETFLSNRFEMKVSYWVHNFEFLKKSYFFKVVRDLKSQLKADFN